MKATFTFLFTLFLAFHLSGQTIPEKYDTPEKRSKIATEQMIEALPLSQGEIPAISRINLKYARIVQKQVIDPELNWWSAFFKMKEINSQREAELFPLLNDTQIRNFNKLKAKTRKEMMGML
ncbi:MAG: hypothetical protein DWQ02_02260 [Bacteroidetes bacterium]|nr:MAG: hypothetical protein DWQ02_02260 [Bacteroidota bacterium]